MKVEFINPFLNATVSVIQTMAQTPVTAGTPALKDGHDSFGEISGIIGLAGEGVSGCMVISFQTEAILPIVSKMLFEEITELNDDITDAVGEITNMISGGAKPELAEVGVCLEMATPITVLGKGIQIRQLSKAPVIQIPFTTAEGKFVVEAALHRQ